MRAQADSDDRLATGEIATWAGPVYVGASPRGVRTVELPRWRVQVEAIEGGQPRRAELGEPVLQPGADPAAQRVLRQALAELCEYFAGRRREFTVALDPQGTSFLRRVWDEVARVPYGQTRSYGEIAQAVGAPGASRAVGRANATNPVAPFVPCHRIVGSDGRLTGYGPGLPLKARLLRMEDALPADATDYDAWIGRIAAQFPGRQLYLGLRPARAYCRPGCARSRALADLPARLFATADEAAAAGFAPCPACAVGSSL